MLKEVLLFFLAILPIIILGVYVYTKDKNREPLKILIKLFLGGLLAAILTMILTIILESVFPSFDSDNIKSTSIGIFVYSFFIVGFIEEISKWIMLYLFAYKNREFDELYDMIVYGVFVALGFAWIENMIYVYNGGVTTAVMRIFLAVPVHVSLGVFMGYFLSLAKFAEVNDNLKAHRKYILLSIIVPIILHGIYDYCLFAGNFFLILFFLAFTITLYIIAFRKIKFILSLKINIIKYYCSNCGNKINDGDNTCTRCGNKI